MIMERKDTSRCTCLHSENNGIMGKLLNVKLGRLGRKRQIYEYKRTKYSKCF